MGPVALCGGLEALISQLPHATGSDALNPSPSPQCEQPAVPFSQAKSELPDHPLGEEFSSQPLCALPQGGLDAQRATSLTAFVKL